MALNEIPGSRGRLTDWEVMALPEWQGTGVVFWIFDDEPHAYWILSEKGDYNRWNVGWCNGKQYRKLLERIPRSILETMPSGALASIPAKPETTVPEAPKTQHFAVGQRVYSRSGQAAQFLQYINMTGQYGRSQFLVQIIYAREPGRPETEWLGGTETWDEVYLEPPMAVYVEEIQNLEVKRDKLKAEVEQLAKERESAEVARRGVLTDLLTLHGQFAQALERADKSCDEIGKSLSARLVDLTKTAAAK